MGKRYIKPRPFILASKYSDSIEEAEKRLTEYCNSGKVDRGNDVFVFSNDGHWSVQPYKDARGLILWDISYLVEPHITSTQIFYTINLKELLELKGTLVCQSQQDYEFYLQVPHSQEEAKWLGRRIWLDDKFIDEVREKEEWHAKYKQIKVLDDVLYEIYHITEIQGLTRYIIKDYILDRAFGLSGYLSRRYAAVLPDYESAGSELRQGKDSGRIAEAEEYIKTGLHRVVERLFAGRRDLFTDSQIEEITEHITNIYIFYHYDDCGLCFTTASIN